MGDRERCRSVIGKIEYYLSKGYPLRGGMQGRPTARTMAARDLGIHRRSIDRILDRAERVHGLKVNEKLFVESGPDSEIRLENQRLKAKLSDLDSKIRKLTDDLLKISNQRDIAWKVANMDVGMGEVKITQHDDFREEVAVLFTSDFQFGEVIDPEEVDGYNRYDMDIALKRYDKLIDKTVNICKKNDISRLVLLRGGDSFSGDIHDDLSLTNEAGIHSCFKSLAAKEMAGIACLCENFDSVDVISVSGNHSLSNPKTRFKNYVEVNYDDLLSWVLATHFSNLKYDNVSFHTPKSGDAKFNIFDYVFILTHGDRIGARGGTGFLGPISTIYRGVLNVLKQQAAVGVRVDYVLMGHFHKPMILPKAIVNGTLAGYNEYAKYALRAEPEDPSQWLFFVHPEHGITRYYQLWVGDR